MASVDVTKQPKCPHCFLTFSTHSTLKRHINHIHNESDVKKHSCNVCDKSFKRKDHLIRHSKTHQSQQSENDRPDASSFNVCDKCGKGFSRKDNLMRHMRSHRKTVDDTSSKASDVDQHNSIKTANSKSNVKSVRKLYSSNKLRRPDVKPNDPMQTGSENSDANEKSDEELCQLLLSYHKSINTYFKQGKILDIFNFRIHNQTADIRTQLLNIWHSKQTTRIKINCSPGFILKHKTTGEYKYYHSCHNNNRLFDHPTLIRSEKDLLVFIDKVIETDILEWVQRQRPNTSWQIQMVTNVSFYLWKILAMGKIGQGVILPDYIAKHKALLAMNKNLHRGGYYTDNLCFFRCLSIKLRCKCKSNCLCKIVNERHARSLFGRYKQKTGFSRSDKQFRGVKQTELLMLEKLFKVSITVFELSPDRIGNAVWCSKSKFSTKLHLNVYKNHFSLIKRLNVYAKAYDCVHCDASYTQLSNLKRHACQANEKRIVFPRKCYRPPDTIFDILESDADIYVEPERRFYPYRITYDIETYMSKENLPPNTAKVSFTAKHMLLSISVCSNVPGHTHPRCFITQGNDTELIRAFVNYISKISEVAYGTLVKEFRDIVQQLDEFVDKRDGIEQEYVEEHFSHPRVYGSRAPSKLRERFLEYLHSIPVVGFNSQSYDLNVMKGPLLKYLYQMGKINYTIKRGNKLQCIQTREFKFVDIINFISPGFSYDMYLKAFGCSQEKGFFPYEYVTDINKLADNTLPPHSSFYSSVKNSNISDEDYKYCQLVWKKHNMSSLADFLRWYSFLDVEPFLEAIDKQSEIYKVKHIDMLKDAISLPGLAVRWKFAESEADQFDIPLLSKINDDLYFKVKGGVVGGPSLVYHRHHQRDVTKIRELEYGAEAQLCKQVLGCDANALYLWCMMQEMPTGSPIRRRAVNNFKPEFSDKFGRLAWGYLEYVAHVNGNYIQHMYNRGEKRVGQHGLPVDGYCELTNTVYQVHGCIFHGHKCDLTSGMEVNPLNGVNMKTLRIATQKKEEYIKALGYRLHVMYECHWRDLMRLDPDISTFVSGLEIRTMSENVSMTEQQIIQALKEDKFFGLIECDIHVPDDLMTKFAEMQPIFKNVEVSRDYLSEHMKAFAEKSGHLKSKQKMLIASMCGNKILLLTSLAKWYLEQGLQITRVYEICQFKPVKCFEMFGNSISEARRAGDADPAKALLGDTCKLIGNSCYGKMITEKLRHRDISYTDSERRASLKIKGHRFISMEEPCSGFFELTQEKQKVVLDTPVVLGFAVLQYAKLRMLQFYYDCIDKFICRSKFQYVEMDTDSAYMALAGELTSIIKPHLREQFFKEYGDWFPRQFCSLHKQEFVDTQTKCKTWTMRECCKNQYRHDRRTPGLFKEEFVGDGIIALNSKTYYCWSEGVTKCTTKGINKKLNVTTKEQFLKVLQTKESVGGVNKGFVKKDNDIYTYSLLRTGLTYFYAKRRVCDDGVSTIYTEL